MVQQTSFTSKSYEETEGSGKSTRWFINSIQERWIKKWINDRQGNQKIQKILKDIRNT